MVWAIDLILFEYEVAKEAFLVSFLLPRKGLKVEFLWLLCTVQETGTALGYTHARLIYL